MKKFLLVFVCSMLFYSPLAGAGDDFNGKGVISGWKFTVLQFDWGLIDSRKLFDGNTDSFFSFGVFILQQKSAVISMALIANTLQYNYGIQLPPPLLGSMTEKNYGISFGFENFCKKCYGIQLGVINHSWAGEKIEEKRKRWQLLGANIADTVYLGIANVSDKIQIGLFNFSPGAEFQFGVLNYNAKSRLPWLPIVNWDMQ